MNYDLHAKRGGYMTKNTPLEMDWIKLPSRHELNARLDRLAIPSDAKVLMGQLLTTTADVAGRVFEVGRSILAFMLDLAKRFPTTTFGAVVGLTISILIGSIPVLGLILGPLLGPLLTAFMITVGALADMGVDSLGVEVQLFGSKLKVAMTRG